MKKLLVILSAMLMIVAVSCSNDTPSVPSEDFDRTDIIITVPTVDENNVAPNGYRLVLENLTNISSRPSESSNSGFINAYDAEGEKVYVMEDGVYTSGVNGDVLKIGDRVESPSGPNIIINGDEYDTSTETGKAYQEDWDRIQETVVREVGSNEKSRIYREFTLTSVPVLDENGLPTVGETNAIVTENVTCTIDISLRTSTTIEYNADGYKKTTVKENTYDLSRALSGVTSLTLYTTEVELSSSSGSSATSVLEVTRDGETSTYAYNI